MTETAFAERIAPATADDVAPAVPASVRRGRAIALRQTEARRA